MSRRNISSLVAVAVALTSSVALASHDAVPVANGTSGPVTREQVKQELEAARRDGTLLKIQRNESPDTPGATSGAVTREQVKQELEAARRDGTLLKIQRNESYVTGEVAATAGFMSSQAQRDQALRLAPPVGSSDHFANGLSFYGAPTAGGTTARVIDATAAKSINVNYDETVVFTAGASRFAWIFNGRDQVAVKLTKIAPAEFGTSPLTVYVGGNSLTRN